MDKPYICTPQQAEEGECLPLIKAHGWQPGIAEAMGDCSVCGQPLLARIHRPPDQQSDQSNAPRPAPTKP